MRIWLGIAAVVVLTAGIVLYVLARRPAPIAVSPAHDAAVQGMADAAMRPDVAAPPVAPIDATIEIDARAPELDRLRSSGEAHEVWVPQATELVHGIDPGAEVECYVAGCGAMLTFPSEAAYQRAAEDVTADRTWTGGKQWSSPVRAGGKVTVALILYRPD